MWSTSALRSASSAVGRAIASLWAKSCSSSAALPRSWTICCPRARTPRLEARSAAIRPSSTSSRLRSWTRVMNAASMARARSTEALADGRLSELGGGVGEGVSVLFPVVLRPLSGMVAQLVHGGGVEETTVDDGVEDLLALADVGQGISVDHDEIGELAGLERPQIGVETQITRAVPGPALQCLVRRHASLDHHPEFPVSAETLALAVRAQLHRDPGVAELPGDPRDIEVIEVLLGRHHAAHRTGVELGRRDELRKPRILPDVGVLVPVVLSPETAVSDEKCRRVTHAVLRPDLESILVDPRDRQVVLDARVPVHDHRHVVLEERSPLGNDHHLEFPRGGEDLLPLLAPRLVVALDAEGANRLHALQVRSGVVEALDLHLDVPAGAVEDRAGREEPRRADDPRARHLARGEELCRVVRRIVRGRDTEGEPGVRGPVLLGDDAVGAESAVPVRVHETR